MSRAYAEQVDVERRDADPAGFRWRGRRYLVRTVLARWTEAGSWWRTSASPSAATVLDDGERDYWRVEAGRGRQSPPGVFDLCFDWSVGAGFLARALD